MKKLYMSLIMAFVFISLYSVNLYAGSNKTNVLSYYAITNQLDGQPMIDMNNVLRFYPVFSFREKTLEVHITIYKNGTRYHVPAIANEDKAYWEIKLPPFELGEAMQRIECEAKIESGKMYGAAAQEYKQSLLQEMKTIRFDGDCNNLACTKYREILKEVENVIQADKNVCDIQCYWSNYIELENLKTSVNKILKTESDIPSVIIDDVASQLAQNEASKTPKKESVVITDVFAKSIAQKISINKSNKEINSILEKNMEKLLSDSSQAGSSIKRADIQISQSGDTASLFYRNYKRGVRYLTALDPAERLGIFRLRYIPFAIVGKELVKPVGDKPTGIFEVGMSFGDPIVTGDDFTVPPFAPERLGVAFAISNEFFSDSARVAAIAITYDFNSYGSLAVGTNFNTKESKIQSYLSFGINKKAFEGLVKAIRNLFE